MNNDIFCIVPFLNFSSTNDGHPRLCCQASTWKDIDIKNLNIKDLWHSKKYNDIRNKFINGEWPDECNICKSRESKGIDSRRQDQLKIWNHLDFNKLINEPKIHYYDLRLGNTCNLKCIMCNPTNSSLWATESHLIEHLGSHNQHEGFTWADGKLLDSIMNNLQDVEVMYFSGGEPLLNKKHIGILDKLIESNLAHKISLEYDTNGTYINKIWMEKWKYFKNILIHLSIDGGKKVNEYVRYPVSYNKIINVIELLNNQPTIRTELQIALGAHNFHDLQSIIDLTKKYNLNVDNQYNISIVEFPKWMTIHNMTNTDKKYCINKYQKCSSRRVKSLLKTLKFTNNTPIQLQNYFKKLDTIRGLDHTNIFHWLYS